MTKSGVTIFVGKTKKTPIFSMMVILFRVTGLVSSTQKAITTEATNALGEKVNMRICSHPNKKAEYIYDMLKYKKMPFRK